MLLPFLSTIDLLLAASVVSAVAGVGTAVFALARHQQAAAARTPEPAGVPAESSQPVTATA